MSFNSDVSKHPQGFNFSRKKTISLPFKRKSAEKHLGLFTNVLLAVDGPYIVSHELLIHDSFKSFNVFQCKVLI